MNPVNKGFLYPMMALQIGAGFLIQKRINYEYDAAQACIDLHDKIHNTLEKCFSVAATAVDPADALNERLRCYESVSWDKYENCKNNEPYPLALLMLGVTIVAALTFFGCSSRPQPREA